MKTLLLIALVFFLACYAGWLLGSPAVSDVNCAARYRESVIACVSDITCEMADDDLLECVGGGK